jgi:hypothetical protein
MNDQNRIPIASAFKHLGVGKSLGDGISSGFTWIGMKGKVFSLKHQGETKVFLRPDDNTASPFLDVVIVGMNPNISKMYYEGNYNEGSANPPDCQAVNGDVPDPGVPLPQAKSCGVCKNNVWGTGPSGRGKACQDHKRLAVLVMPYMTEKMFNGTPLLEPVYLKVPPDSLKAIKAYGDNLVHRGAHYASVVTRITFAPDRLFQLVFTLKQPLTNDEAPVILPLLEDPQTRNIVGGTMVEVEEALPELPIPEQKTGLLEAFGVKQPTAEVTAFKRPGRPAGSKNKPKPVIEAEPVVQQEDPSENVVGGGDAPWEEDDAEISAGIAAHLHDKVGKMLPNK